MDFALCLVVLGWEREDARHTGWCWFLTCATDMSEPYEELIEGEWTLRLPPRPSHESLCLFLHRRVAEVIHAASPTRQLSCRELVELDDKNKLRPDLSLVTRQTNRLWLAGEGLHQEDHHADTVVKKGVYEALKIPRLWIVDPRYENVEIYHASTYGLSLRETLMLKEVLAEPLLPGFQLPVGELFAAAAGSGPARLGRHDF